MWPHPLCVYSRFCLYTAEPTGQLAEQRQDGDLFNEARGERETEGPDYKQTKQFYIFWAEMWQTFISLQCPLARFLMRCDRPEV